MICYLNRTTSFAIDRNCIPIGGADTGSPSKSRVRGNVCLGKVAGEFSARDKSQLDGHVDDLELGELRQTFRSKLSADSGVFRMAERAIGGVTASDGLAVRAGVFELPRPRANSLLQWLLISVL